MKRYWKKSKQKHHKVSTGTDHAGAEDAGWRAATKLKFMVKKDYAYTRSFSLRAARLEVIGHNGAIINLQGGGLVKVSMYLVTYEGKKRTERLFNEIPADEKRKIGKELTDKFMKRAGFEPARKH